MFKKSHINVRKINISIDEKIQHIFHDVMKRNHVQATFKSFLCLNFLIRETYDRDIRLLRYIVYIIYWDIYTYII